MSVLRKIFGPRVRLSHLSAFTVLESNDWSDEEGIDPQNSVSPDDPSNTLSALDAKFHQLQLLVQNVVGVSADDTTSIKVPTASEIVGVAAERDDDSHYFESYGFQG